MAVDYAKRLLALERQPGRATVLQRKCGDPLRKYELYADFGLGLGARPVTVWHSGKLRAKQTAEAFWRACNALAELSATRDLQPDDPPLWFRDRLRGESRDILIAGHFHHLPRLLTLMIRGSEDAPVPFPLHGVVALETVDEGETWVERWRLEV